MTRPKAMWLRTPFVVCLALLTPLFTSIAANAGVTIEFLAPSAQWSTVEKEAPFFLKVSGGTLSGVHCWVSSLSSERGDPAPRDSFECKAPDNLAPGAVAQLSLKLSSTAALKRGTYSSRNQRPTSEATPRSNRRATLCARWRRKGPCA